MKKIKLRDMTHEQWMKFVRSKPAPCYSCKNCPFAYVSCVISREFAWVNNKDMFSDKFLDQEIEVEE